MTHKKPIEAVERETLVAVKDWRAADKEAVCNKGDDQLQRKEYNARKDLRTAADSLIEAHHG